MKLQIFPLILILFFTIQNSTAQKTTKDVASYYHQKFEGRQTANGEIFSNDSLTAAHKTLPFGTIVRVTHLKNGKEVTVRINDRLPASSTRTIDLSKKAATELSMIKSGLAKVQLEIIQDPIGDTSE